MFISFSQVVVFVGELLIRISFALAMDQSLKGLCRFLESLFNVLGNDCQYSFYLFIYHIIVPRAQPYDGLSRPM
jgi:hypothetical protein